MGFQPTGETVVEREKKARKIKRSGLRVINNGMRYDISGNLRRMAREIERGERGDVRDTVVVLRVENQDPKSASIDVMHWGTGTVADAHWMVCTAKNRLEPA